MTEENKRVAVAFTHRLWNEKQLKAIDDFLHPNCVIHNLFGDFHGTEYMKKVVPIWLSGFPDLVIENNAVICEGDLVAIHWEANGPHQGEFRGIKPTGKMISYSGVSLYRIGDGKISECWNYFDMQQLLNQIS